MTPRNFPEAVRGIRGAGERKSYGTIAKRGVAWSFFREGVSEMMTMPTAIVMARLLSPFDLGIAASTRARNVRADRARRTITWRFTTAKARRVFRFNRRSTMSRSGHW